MASARNTVAIITLAMYVGAIGCGTNKTNHKESRATSKPESREKESATAIKKPDLRFRIDKGRHSHSAHIEILSGTAELAAELVVEQKTKSGWQAMTTVRLDGCETAPTDKTDCLKLIAGASLDPPPFSIEDRVLACKEHHCERCNVIPAGAYRVVAKNCSDTFSLASTSFEVN